MVAETRRSPSVRAELRSNSRNFLLEVLSNPPENPKDRQNLLYKVTARILWENRNYFIMVEDCCKQAGINRGIQRNFEDAEKILKTSGVPVGMIPRTFHRKNGLIYISRSYFLFPVDKDSAIEQLKKNKDKLDLRKFTAFQGIDEYPYAHPATHEFLKVAISEKAHLQVPIINRLVAGIYYSSDATFEDIGKQAGWLAQRERPRQLIDEFIVKLWRNCSEDTKRRFPLMLIPTAKPLTEKSRERKIRSKDLADGGKKTLVLSLIQNGLKLEKISELTDVAVYRIKNIVKDEIERRLGYPKSRKAFNRRLRILLKNPPKEFIFRQELLERVEYHFYRTHYDTLATLTDCFRRAGLHIEQPDERQKRFNIALNALHESEIAATSLVFKHKKEKKRHYRGKIVKNGKKVKIIRIEHRHILYRSDLARASAIIKKTRGLR